MGNITSGAPQQVVRLVRPDGKVLEFYDEFAVEELQAVYPKFFVCHVQVQENGQGRRKMLSDKDVLQKGQVYRLLPMSTQQQKPKPHGVRNYVNGVNRTPKIHPVDVPTTGHQRSSHPLPQQQTHRAKIGVAVKPVFRNDQIGQILESGSVEIITKDGTTRLSGPQLTRLLNEASSHGVKSALSHVGKLYPSPMASSLSLGLESIPEEPHHVKPVAM